MSGPRRVPGRIVSACAKGSECTTVGNCPAEVVGYTGSQLTRSCATWVLMNVTCRIDVTTILTYVPSTHHRAVCFDALFFFFLKRCTNLNVSFCVLHI